MKYVLIATDADWYMVKQGSEESKTSSILSTQTSMSASPSQSLQVMWHA